MRRISVEGGDFLVLSMLFRLFMVLLLLGRGHSACMRSLLSKNEGSLDQEVFVDEEDANLFLGRQLLFNRFDFEMFVPGNLERECYEEICNYEEAREVFENVPDTNTFWKRYIEDKEKHTSRVDVTSVLVGVISAAVGIVVIVLLIMYCCRCQRKDNFSRGSSIRARPRRSNAPLIMQRLEDVSLHPEALAAAPPSPEDVYPPGLPSYDQAISRTGQHDAPPPPYPGSRPGSVCR